MHIDNRVSSLEAARKFLSEYECVTINLPQHAIRKVKFLSKNLILTKPQHFHEFFTPKNRQFSRQIKDEFLDKKISNSVLSKLDFWR